MKRSLLSLLLALTTFSSTALAADRRCGVDTDLNGSVDQACDSPDADGDGYATNGLGRNSGTDCYETAPYGFYIYPGVSTSIGCSAGNYRTCQSDGTFTSCSAVSGYTCSEGSGSTYFVDDAETDCSGAGTYADPEDWRCWANTGMSGYHAPGAGDCIVFLGGTYSSSWSSGAQQFYLNNTTDGTSSAHVTIRALPGSTWWEAGIGSGVLITGVGSFGGSQVEPVHIGGVNYSRVQGFEIKNVGTGFGTAGIHVDDAALNYELSNNYVHDIDGEEDNNTACIKLRGGSNSGNIHHNVMKDCYERFATTGDSGWNSQNNSEFRSMDNDLLWIHDNVVVNTADATYGIDFKHGVDGATGNLVEGNIVIGAGYEGIASDAIPHTLVRDNYIYDVCKNGATPGALGIFNFGGGGQEMLDMIFEYNTVVKSPAFHAYNDAIDSVGGNTHIFRYNVISDDETTYSTDNSANGFYHVAGYGSDAMRTDILSRGYSDYNCYYNENSTTLRFSFFEATSGGWGPAGAAGQAYSGLAAWQAIFDTHSYNENPSFNSKGIATSTNCTGKGWRLCGVNNCSGGGGGSSNASKKPGSSRLRMRAR